jgi:MarR family transcriptional regulator, organic hydroperoxide resistance regulator
MARTTTKKPETRKLADFMCFTIYSTNLAYSRVYKPVLEQLGVTYPQYVAIISLSERDGQTVKGLSESLFSEPSTVTPMLQRLEKMGYVRRTRDKDDERSVRVNLTDAGRRLRERGLGFSEQTVKASGLSSERFSALQKSVARLRDNLSKASKGA